MCQAIRTFLSQILSFLSNPLHAIEYLHKLCKDCFSRVQNISATFLDFTTVYVRSGLKEMDKKVSSALKVFFYLTLC